MIQIEAMSWDEAQAKLATEWRNLVREQGFNPSLDPAWMDVAIRSHGRTEDAVVYCARNRDRLVGVLPLLCSHELKYGIQLKTVDLASNVVSYHPELIASEHANLLLAEALCRAHGGRWDLFRADQIPDGSPSAAVLKDYFESRGGTTFSTQADTSPYIAIEGGWEDLLNSRSANFRSNRKRRLRRVRDYGITEMRWFESEADVVPLLQDLYAIEKRSWKATQGIAITDRPAEQRYHELLLPMLAKRRSLLANVLYISETPVAYVLCAHWNGWVGHLKTSFDEAFDHVGAVVIDDSIQRAYHIDAKEYDFLGAATQHKMHWTDRARIHHSHWRYARRPFASLIAFAKTCATGFRST